MPDKAVGTGNPAGPSREDIALADNLVSGLIRYLEREYSGSLLQGMALRLRWRLAHLRATGEWHSLYKPDIKYPHHLTDPLPLDAEDSAWEKNG